MMKLGSLFDGSGGFPLAGVLCGITPAWAAEVEPYPIAVTRSRFPSVKHLGNVSKVDGAKIEPVDIITFGSPCQDLSVAGKRAGLKHEGNGDEETTRSGLFMEAVRIIKEMRVESGGRYPTLALWENVPGAFSSNKGEDFRIVLQELIQIIEPGAVMPAVPKSGWPYADHYCGDGWSLAYRVLDAQFWGVPQRRRRIFLVVDFAGQCAREILFERKGLRGYFAESGTERKGTAADAEGSVRADDPSGIVLDDQGGSQITVRMDGKSPTLRAEMHGNIPAVLYQPFAFAQNQRDEVRDLNGVAGALAAEPGMKQQTFVAIPQFLFENHSQDARYKGPMDVCPMLPAQLGTGGNNTPFVVERTPVYCLQGNGIDRADTAGCNGKGWTEDASYTLNTIDRPAVAYCVGNGQLNQISMNEQCNTLDCMHDQQAVLVFDKEMYNSGKNATGGHYIAEGGPAPSLRTKHPPGVCARYIVRRLTPTECARLQGFPDFWGHPDRKEDFTDEEYRFWLDVRNTHAEINGKQVKEHTKPQMLTWYNKLHTDSAEYKMWGNGIALPCALYAMQGISEVLMRRYQGGLNMRYRCGFPEWEKNERPCDNPNEENVKCEDCQYTQTEEEKEK